MTTRPLIALDARKTLVALILIAGANPVARAREQEPELTSKSVILKDANRKSRDCKRWIVREPHSAATASYSSIAGQLQIRLRSP